MLMKTHELIDNRDEASMLLKGKEKDVRSSIGVIWNGISFEKMVIPTGGASPHWRKFGGWNRGSGSLWFFVAAVYDRRLLIP
jgi:hypothetical protein